MGRDRARTSETNRSVVTIALVAVLLGIGLFWLDDQVSSDSWSAIINNIGGLVIATGLLAVGWELLGKRAFADELIAKVQLRTDVVGSGLQRITDQYLEDVEWADLIVGAQKVDIVVHYANTWRNAHHQRLQAVAANKKARMRIFLPDPDDEQTLITLARRFDRPADDIEKDIRQAIREFTEMHTPGGADLQVYLRAGDMVFSCYRFDSRAVLALYSHSRRRSLVPTFVVGSGNIWDFVYGEVQEIQKQSRQIFPRKEGA